MIDREFLSSFKDGTDLQQFFRELQGRAVSQMLEDEMDGVENVIVSLYAKGMSIMDIEDMLREVYGFQVSEATISRITDRVAEDVVAWQNRPLDSVYPLI